MSRPRFWQKNCDCLSCIPSRNLTGCPGPSLPRARFWACLGAPLCRDNEESSVPLSRKVVLSCLDGNPSPNWYQSSNILVNKYTWVSLAFWFAFEWCDHYLLFCTTAWTAFELSGIHCRILILTQWMFFHIIEWHDFFFCKLQKEPLWTTVNHCVSFIRGSRSKRVRGYD